MEISREETSTVSPLSHQKPQSPSPGPSDKPSTSRHTEPAFGSLENTGWAAEVMDWNETERKVLQSAWRPSTLRTYKPAWESWLQWAKNEDISPSTPDPKDLARYLIHLHEVRKLAPRTVLVHKSVVATFTNPSKDSLSNHPIVKKVIKAIMLKNPPSHSLSTWDVADFLKWVSGRNVEVSNLFQVSQHLATLLLLATGRRIHDLTLLHIDSDRCHITRDKIIIWPAFGSKTDNTKYRQSGWCLSKNDDLKLDLCYWIPILVEATKLRRGADSTLTNMFITTRGKVKAASKSIIAGWLRHTFKNANIKCSPGSFRSAVATNNWSKKNLNLDEVLRKGNWCSSSTFFKHYFKEIEPRSTVPQLSMADNFTAI